MMALHSRWTAFRRPRGTLAGWLVLALLASGSQLAVAQNSGPSQTAPPAGQESARPAPMGLLYSVGRWLEDSWNGVKATMRGARGTLDTVEDRARSAAKDAADAAKGAAETVTRLPGSRVVEGRERCAVAANGAPDCRAAAAMLCRGRGFSAGTSVDIQSAQKCPARIWLSGRSPEASECDLESFVTRAMCQ